MLNKSILISVILGLFLSTALFAGDTYQIDPAHSSADFSVSHFVINKVKGNFKDLSGTIIYDENNIENSEVAAQIVTKSISTNNEGRDKHLRSGDFFDAENHPEITFTSKRVVKNENGLIAVGDFTMRGVTKEISIPFEIVGKIKDPWGNTRIGITATLTIDRLDYGVSWNNTMDNGGLVVGNEVQIELNVEAIQQSTKS